MHRFLSLIQAYGSSEKYMLMCDGLLAIYVFNVNLIYVSDNLLVVAE
jgi:hypothetical protein